MAENIRSTLVRPAYPSPDKVNYPDHYFVSVPIATTSSLGIASFNGYYFKVVNGVVSLSDEYAGELDNIVDRLDDVDDRLDGVDDRLDDIDDDITDLDYRLDGVDDRLDDVDDRLDDIDDDIAELSNMTEINLAPDATGTSGGIQIEGTAHIDYNDGGKTIDVPFIGTLPITAGSNVTLSIVDGKVVLSASGGGGGGDYVPIVTTTGNARVYGIGTGGNQVIWILASAGSTGSANQIPRYNSAGQLFGNDPTSAGLQSRELANAGWVKRNLSKIYEHTISFAYEDWDGSPQKALWATFRYLSASSTALTTLDAIIDLPLEFVGTSGDYIDGGGEYGLADCRFCYYSNDEDKMLYFVPCDGVVRSPGVIYMDSAARELISISDVVRKL